MSHLFPWLHKNMIKYSGIYGTTAWSVIFLDSRIQILSSTAEKIKENLDFYSFVAS